MWYYLDHSRGQRGPVSTTTLISLVSKGALKKRTYVWRKGFSKWRPLNEIRELSPGTTTPKTTTFNTLNQQDEIERKRKLEEAAAARAAARALDRGRVEDERKLRQIKLEEERRKRVAAQKRAEIERKKRLAKQREEEEERRRECIRKERIAQVASSRATSIAVSAATSARATATAATLISYSKREDLESKKEQQRQAWTAESKTTKEEKWYVFVREHLNVQKLSTKSHGHRFYVDSKGSQRRPMSKSILKSLIDTNTITSSTYVWKVSMKNWKRLRDVPSLLRRSNEER